jgi:hypothetical protein
MRPLKSINVQKRSENSVFYYLLLGVKRPKRGDAYPCFYNAEIYNPLNFDSIARGLGTGVIMLFLPFESYSDIKFLAMASVIIKYPSHFIRCFQNFIN